MKLISIQMLNCLPKTSDVLNQELKERIVYYHFFNPIGKGDWYVLSAEKVENEYKFYGYVYLSRLQEDFFTLRELVKMQLPFDEKLVREVNFEKITADLLLSSLSI